MFWFWKFAPFRVQHVLISNEPPPNNFDTAGDNSLPHIHRHRHRYGTAGIIGSITGQFIVRSGASESQTRKMLTRRERSCAGINQNQRNNPKTKANPAEPRFIAKMSAKQEMGASAFLSRTLPGGCPIVSDSDSQIFHSRPLVLDRPSVYLSVSLHYIVSRVCTLLVWTVGRTRLKLPKNGLLDIQISQAQVRIIPCCSGHNWTSEYGITLQHHLLTPLSYLLPTDRISHITHLHLPFPVVASHASRAASVPRHCANSP
ncbi:hypothetical protein J6590_017539 [Homalodisca vitripennis]|nr:hypothetical protein J6590_017539 [Homalodisca vitripennis]